MTEEEDIDSYMVRVNEVVNSIRGVGETLENSVVCQKILRSVLPRYDSKVSVIEEAKDLDIITLDEVHGTLKTYEMRTEKDDVDDHAMFMVFEEKENDSPRTSTTSEDEEEEEVDFEAELRSALKELKKEEDFEEKLSQKTTECTKLESENLSLKAKLEGESNILAEYSDFQKEIDALKAKVAEFENDSSIHDIETSSQVHPSSKKLDEILSSQRSTHNKFDLGFVGESSKSAKEKEKSTAQNPITVKDKRVEKNRCILVARSLMRSLVLKDQLTTNSILDL
ncbi:uncharacterized protein LOC122655331 [Telopea speciosissima]|uniref:uncharacterized protein LOC122655331 n=1 Tax=Telopea speciosissima TaxID=54955 RepID=UPI001CC512E2|nr:uncharacterized protein LOC122655331 [Telopea speciosissima]